MITPLTPRIGESDRPLAFDRPGRRRMHLPDRGGPRPNCRCLFSVSGWPRSEPRGQRSKSIHSACKDDLSRLAPNQATNDRLVAAAKIELLMAPNQGAPCLSIVTKLTGTIEGKAPCRCQLSVRVPAPEDDRTPVLGRGGPTYMDVAGDDRGPRAIPGLEVERVELVGEPEGSPEILRRPMTRC